MLYFWLCRNPDMRHEKWNMMNGGRESTATSARAGRSDVTWKMIKIIWGGDKLRTNQNPLCNLSHDITTTVRTSSAEASPLTLSVRCRMKPRNLDSRWAELGGERFSSASRMMERHSFTIKTITNPCHCAAVRCFFPSLVTQLRIHLHQLQLQIVRTFILHHHNEWKNK